MRSIADIESYIGEFPGEVQTQLQKLRYAIQIAAPLAEEKISYGIPTFTYHGNLVHFGAYPNHIGFYPGASAVEAFKDDISAFKTSKGTIHFKLNGPLPLALVADIVKFRLEENVMRAKQKRLALK